MVLDNSPWTWARAGAHRDWRWRAGLALVIAGELPPGTSAAMRWVGSTGIGDKALRYGAYTLLAGIPAEGFAQPGGKLWAGSIFPLGVERTPRYGYLRVLGLLTVAWTLTLDDNNLVSPWRGS